MVTPSASSRQIQLLYFVLLLLGFAIALIMAYLRGNDLDFDEFYSIAMSRNSFFDIWQITARDVHPPLYYDGLKLFSFLFPSLVPEKLYYLRLFSILGYMASLLFCCFPVRRLWGDKTAIFTIIVLILLPNSFYTYTNLRMYTWAIFFVLAIFVYACDALRNNNWQTWLKLSLVSLAAMYIHYYALVYTFFVYLSLLLIVLFAYYSRDKEFVRKLRISYLISAIIITICYLPWVFHLLWQIGTVNENYWINRPGLVYVLSSAQYYFSPKYYTEFYLQFFSSSWFLIIVFALILLVVTLLLINIRLFKSDRKIKTAFAALFAISMPVAFVLGYTFFVRPIFDQRYLSCYMGVFALMVGLLLAKAFDNVSGRQKILVCLFFFFLIFDFFGCVYIAIKRDMRYRASEISQELNSFMDGVNNVYTDSPYIPPQIYMLAPAYHYFYVETDLNKNTIHNEHNDGPFQFHARIVKIEDVVTDNSFVYIKTEDVPVNNQVIFSNFVPVDSFYHKKVMLYKMERFNE